MLARLLLQSVNGLTSTESKSERLRILELSSNRECSGMREELQ